MGGGSGGAVRQATAGTGKRLDAARRGSEPIATVDRVDGVDLVDEVDVVDLVDAVDFSAAYREGGGGGLARCLVRTL